MFCPTDVPAQCTIISIQETRVSTRVSTRVEQKKSALGAGGTLGIFGFLGSQSNPRINSLAEPTVSYGVPEPISSVFILGAGAGFVVLSRVKKHRSSLVLVGALATLGNMPQDTAVRTPVIVTRLGNSLTISQPGGGVLNIEAPVNFPTNLAGYTFTLQAVTEGYQLCAQPPKPPCPTETPKPPTPTLNPKEPIRALW